MNRKNLFAAWGGLFIICAGLGFIPGFAEEVAGALRALLVLLSLAFFVPPALLLYVAYRDRDVHTLKLVRNLSALSLGLTLAVLVGNVLSALGPELLGTLLHCILIVVSTPMLCSGYWALSLFLWACLLMVSLTLLRKR